MTVPNKPLPGSMRVIPNRLPYTTRQFCRVCGSNDLTPLFSLGEQYVNNFVTMDRLDEGEKCPIDLELCNNCTLVQMKHTAPQAILYERFYWYRSGVTQTMRTALLDVVNAAAEILGPTKPGDVVLDIGSNDGTLLRYYHDDVIKVGVEPAKNLAEEGSKGVDVFINDFWNYETYNWNLIEHMVDGKKAKIITAIGMFYDLEDPNQFIGDVAKALSPDGIFIAQLMCLRDMFRRNDVGNLAHEHLEYYSLRSLEYLFKKHGMEIFDIEQNDVNGSSTRLYVRLIDNTLPPRPRGSVQRVNLAFNSELDYAQPEIYQDFFDVMERNKKAVVEFINKAVYEGQDVWVYGASTKGNTILQYYGLDHTLITGAAERSPEKYGKFTVGTMIPIVSEAEARMNKPDYFLVLPYAFIDEFVEREKDQEWRKTGGKFIVPLPEFRLV